MAQPWEASTTALAIARYSASTPKRKTGACLLDDQDIRLSPSIGLFIYFYLYLKNTKKSNYFKNFSYKNNINIYISKYIYYKNIVHDYLIIFIIHRKCLVTFLYIIKFKVKWPIVNENYTSFRESLMPKIIHAGTSERDICRRDLTWHTTRPFVMVRRYSCPTVCISDIIKLITLQCYYTYSIKYGVYNIRYLFCSANKSAPYIKVYLCHHIYFAWI